MSRQSPGSPVTGCRHWIATKHKRLALSTGNHTKVKIGDRQNVVPRHQEINEITAKKILEHFETRKED